MIGSLPRLPCFPFNADMVLIFVLFPSAKDLFFFVCHIGGYMRGCSFYVGFYSCRLWIKRAPILCKSTWGWKQRRHRYLSGLYHYVIRTSLGIMSDISVPAFRQNENFETLYFYCLTCNTRWDFSPWVEKPRQIYGFYQTVTWGSVYFRHHHSRIYTLCCKKMTRDNLLLFDLALLTPDMHHMLFCSQRKHSVN